MVAIASACIGKIDVFVSCFAIRDRKHASHRYHAYQITEEQVVGWFVDLHV